MRLAVCGYIEVVIWITNDPAPGCRKDMNIELGSASPEPRASSTNEETHRFVFSKAELMVRLLGLIKLQHMPDECNLL